MNAIIIGNGTISDYKRLKEYLTGDTFVICADGGYYHAQNADIVPNLIIGDFDSSEIPHNDIKKCIYPSRKDFTDGEICMKYVCDNNFDKVTMFGMTGTRLDHTMNNLMMLFKHRNSSVVDDFNEIYPFTDTFDTDGKKGHTLSILPLDGNIEGVTTYGLDYPLSDETLYFGEGRGISNLIVEDSCRITCKSGKGLIIINNGE